MDQTALTRKKEKKPDPNRHHSAQHADGGNDNLLQNSCLQPRSGRVFAEHPQVLIFIIMLNWHDVATRVQSASVEGRCCFKVFIIMTWQSCSLKFHIPFSLG